MKTFAAIHVGSYEVEMKIFEFTARNGMKEIDHIRHRIELGNDTYGNGKVSHEKMDDLCRVLREFTQIMKTYRVTEYRAYATSAIRETANTTVLLDQLRQRTGLEISVMSNSEQRFLDYKSIASRGEQFGHIIEKGTVILDIGGASIQASLFENGRLISTQNMKLGILRLREALRILNARPSKFEMLLDEMISTQLSVFKKMYIKDKTVENIIVVDAYLSNLICHRLLNQIESDCMDSASFQSFLEELRTSPVEESARKYDISRESLQLLALSSVLVKQMIRITGAKLIWAPGATLCDGIAYEYGEKKRLIREGHDFEEDILACTRTISKRFMGSKRRGETLEQITLTIFDSMKKIHGMGKRERLLLRIAALLHDCGKYISLVNLGECSYEIIMSTEIIGISHTEREIVANVVKYNHMDFVYYESIRRETGLDAAQYLVIAKLAAILRVANALDRSHKQKFKDFKTALKDDQLILTVNTSADITLEKGLFGARADFFEEVFSIRPVIKQKKIY